MSFPLMSKALPSISVTSRGQAMDESGLKYVLTLHTSIHLGARSLRSARGGLYGRRYHLLSRWTGRKERVAHDSPGRRTPTYICCAC